MVQVQHPSYRDGCGGSLISKRHVLTAYHCIRDLVPEDIIVQVGGHNAQHSKLIDGEGFRVARTVYPRPNANNATGYVTNKGSRGLQGRKNCKYLFCIFKDTVLSCRHW